MGKKELNRSRKLPCSNLPATFEKILISIFLILEPNQSPTLILGTVDNLIWCVSTSVFP